MADPYNDAGNPSSMAGTDDWNPASTSERLQRGYKPMRGGTVLSPYYFTISSVENFERQLQQAQTELGIKSGDFIPVQYMVETSMMMELLMFAPTLLMMGLVAYYLRNAPSGKGAGGGMFGGMANQGKSKAKKFSSDDVNVTFKDVAGVNEAKKEIMEFVQFLKEPEFFTQLGAKMPKGALLVGPPGTGKTLLAKATAGEAGVPFYSISGSDFVEMFVGVGPARVRDLFKEARENAPCMIFIDEIDAVARARNKGGFSGGNDERENTLNQLLVEMDGFQSTEGIVVLAGTNRADILDEAILRPGRFDRQITVDNPDIAGRKEIALIHLKGLKLKDSPDEIAGRIAALTPGFSGAQLANICNEAAIQAARMGAENVTVRHFELASDRVIGGLESNKMISMEEKRTVAYHEAGHAIAGWFLEHSDPLLKVTIVPRASGALGFAQYLPKDVSLHSKEQLKDTICMALGGRVAEEICFGKVTTGASDDLNRVTKMAYQMVQVLGMNERIGNLSFPKTEQGKAGRLYGEDTAEAMDLEARKLVDEMYERTFALLSGKEDELTAVAEELLRVETINRDDVIRLIGARPYDDAMSAMDTGDYGAADVVEVATPDTAAPLTPPVAASKTASKTE
jgi:AFG3 family protein